MEMNLQLFGGRGASAGGSKGGGMSTEKLEYKAELARGIASHSVSDGEIMRQSSRANRINQAVDEANAMKAKSVGTPAVWNKMSGSGKHGLLDAAGVGSEITVESRGLSSGMIAENTLKKLSSGKWQVIDGPVNSVAHFDQNIVSARNIAYGTTATKMNFK